MKAINTKAGSTSCGILLPVGEFDIEKTITKVPLDEAVKRLRKLVVEGVVKIIPEPKPKSSEAKPKAEPKPKS